VVNVNLSISYVSCETRIEIFIKGKLIQCAAKKVSPEVICHFLRNHLEFLDEILHIYYLFIYT